MLLHENKLAFKDILEQTSRFLGVKVSIIEKDYYVFLTLKYIIYNNDEVMFKGGTSLSKALGVINRFSEDIDLNLKPEISSTDSHRTKLSRSMRCALEYMNLSYDSDTIVTRREYNTVEALFNPMFKDNALTSVVKVEGMANKRGKILNATYTYRAVSNYIWDAYLKAGNIVVLEKLKDCDLEPFNVPVQNMDVTFVEKVMSLTNNYLRERSERLSRHLYDIFCMANFGNLCSYDLASTMNKTKVYLIERTNDICLRQQSPASYYLLLALQQDFYKEDFNTITRNMKFNPNDGITYDMCKSCLVQLIYSIGTF